MRLQAVFAALLVLTAPGPALADQPKASCPGIEDGGSNPSDVDNFYAQRTLQIMRDAKAGAETALDAFVSPKAEFEIWRGDATSSARHKGAQGVEEMFRDLKPVRYIFYSVFSGPIVVVAENCSWSVSFLFRDNDPDVNGALVKFDFVDGLLLSAKGREVTLTEGDVR